MEVVKRVLFAGAGWLLPGLGHVLRGERAKGIVLGVAILGCFFAGEIMSEFHAVSRKEHRIAFLAQIGAGGPCLGSLFYDEKYHQNQGRPLFRRPMEVPPLLDCGIMYTCVAGLLSFVMVVDVLFPLRERYNE